MCYYSFNYKSLILVRKLIKYAAEMNTWEHIDRYAYVIYRVSNALKNIFSIHHKIYWNYIPLLSYQLCISYILLNRSALHTVLTPQNTVRNICIIFDRDLSFHHKID